MSSRRHRHNRYSDIEINVLDLDHSSPEKLHRSLAVELAKWEHGIGSRCESAIVWIRVPIRHARIVPWLLGLDEGRDVFGRLSFRIHHATQDGGFVLARPHTPGRCTVPLYGTHYARVESVVIEKDTGALLVIRENVGTASGVKMVTGSVDPGEYVGHAAEREVMEETGISARFMGVIGLGHRLKTRFDKDELLVGCLLQAPAGQTPKADGGEVKYAAWVRPEEAAAVCNPMAHEWLAIVAGMKSGPMRTATVDDFRGHGYTMELHAI
jgi:8-oxo-dGTP pyrophosphatase MutT (NUDIX family)